VVKNEETFRPICIMCVTTGKSFLRDTSNLKYMPEEVCSSGLSGAAMAFSRRLKSVGAGYCLWSSNMYIKDNGL